LKIFIDARMPVHHNLADIRTSATSPPTNNKGEGNNKYGSKGTLICEECRRRKKICHFPTDRPDKPCDFCRERNITCGQKYTKQGYLRRGENDDGVKFAQHATVLVDYFLRDMKVDDSTRKDEDLLDALQGAIDQKRRQLQMKRGHAMVDQANPDQLTASQSSTDTPSPPIKKRATSEFTEQSSRYLPETRSPCQSERGSGLPPSSVSPQSKVAPATQPTVLQIQIEQFPATPTIDNTDQLNFGEWGNFVDISGWEPMMPWR
jgi:hypothetical protein